MIPHRTSYLIVLFCLVLDIAIPGYAQNTPYFETITYGQNPMYEANIYFKVLAIKGRQFLDVSSARQPNINFYNTTIFPEQGNQQLKIEFTKVEFAEDNHARKYSLQIALAKHQDAFLVAGNSTRYVLLDPNKNNKNTTASVLFDIPETGTKFISFLCNVIDDNDRIIGQGSIAKQLNILPPPKAEPVSEPPVQAVQTRQQQMTEDEFWQSIVNNNNIEDFEYYNLKYPNGKYNTQANEKILTIREDQAWSRTIQVNTLNEYRTFLARYPNSKYKREAQNKIAALSPSTPAKEPEVNEEDAYWKSVIEQDQVFAYKEYLSKYPKGKYAEAALQKIPLEILANRSSYDDLTYLVMIRYASPSMGLSTISIPDDTLTFQPTQPGIPSDATLPYAYVQWPEGEITINVVEQAPGLTSLRVQLGKRKKYELQFVDGIEMQNISLEADIPPLSIQNIENLNSPKDTVFFEIAGGVPSYFLRLVADGNNVTQGEIEQELLLDPGLGKYYINRTSLMESELPDGSYVVYILDSRKTDYQSWDDEAFIINEGKMNIKIWQILLPVLLIIILLIFLLNKRSKKNSGYGGA